MDAEAYLHIVMDAYRGDVVSLPSRLDLVEDGAPAGDGGAEDAVVTVRLAPASALPELPAADAWHVRFVSPGGVLDARTSDGTLKRLRLADGALTVTLDAGEALASLDVERGVAAKRVTHVLLVPESRKRA